jgi:hypothetical protein
MEWQTVHGLSLKTCAPSRGATEAPLAEGRKIEASAMKSGRRMKEIR